MIKEARKKVTVLESSPTSLSILAKNTQLQCNIFQTKQKGNQKVQNNGCSNAYFWVNLPWIIQSAKFKMADDSNNSPNLVHTNAHARPCAKHVKHKSPTTVTTYNLRSQLTTCNRNLQLAIASYNLQSRLVTWKLISESITWSMPFRLSN